MAAHYSGRPPCCNAGAADFQLPTGGGARPCPGRMLNLCALQIFGVTSLRILREALRKRF
jgi:hypothetical protein